MKLWFIGFPGGMGGANTESQHLLKLFLDYGLEVHVIPTWGADPAWKAKLESWGATVHAVTQKELTDGSFARKHLAGEITLGMCNHHYIGVAPILRDVGAKIVWMNCMTFMFDHETRFFAAHGPADAMIYQSVFQRECLERALKTMGYDSTTGHVIRGAFDWKNWPFAPTKRSPGEPYVIGRISRPDLDKWSSNLVPIYDRVQVSELQARLLGVNEGTKRKLGAIPHWMELLPPQAEPVPDFLATIHACLTVNGGARENWPRVGLECFASGVPVIAQDKWGWQEMIEHGVTGFLGTNDAELAHYAAELAYDEGLRLRIARQARERLEQVHAAPDVLWKEWSAVFEPLA